MDNWIDRGDCESTTQPMARGETVPLLVNATFARDGSQAHSGSYSYRMTIVAGGSLGVAYLVDNNASTNMHGFIPGREYDFTAWLRIPSGGVTIGEILFLCYEFYSGSWKLIGNENITVYDTWAKINFKITINPLTTGFMFYPRLNSTCSAGEFINIDDISVIKTPSDNWIDRGDCENVVSPMLRGEITPIIGSATWAIDATQSYAGSYSYRMTRTTAPGPPNSAVYFQDDLVTTNMHGLVAGGVYRFESKVRIPSGGMLGTECRLSVYERIGGAWVKVETVLAANTYDAWQDVSFNFTLDSSATGVFISANIFNTADNGEYFNIDEIGIIEGMRDLFNGGLLKSKLLIGGIN